MRVQSARTIQRRVREAAEIFTYGTVGAVNHGSEEPYELAFTRVIVPATSIDDVARLPQVLGIELSPHQNHRMISPTTQSVHTTLGLPMKQRVL